MPLRAALEIRLGSMLGATDARKLPQLDTRLPVERRVELLLASMTLDEKVRQLHGTGQMRAPANWRLAIPSLQACDGPHGVGTAVWRPPMREFERATSFPVSIALAATWDPVMAEQVGAAIAREARAKARNWLLAPCVNIVRDPRAGRTQECFGEDPYLAARIGVGFVRGVQSQSVIATVKHFACHNQETDDGRRHVEVRVDERALREIYLPAFEACVREGGALCVMTARHGVNGPPSGENRRLLTGILKGEWGFRGFVVGDWETIEDTRRFALAGMDVEMPKEVHYGRALAREVRAGRIEETAVDEAVRRVLRVKFLAGLFDRERRRDPAAINTVEHRRLALEVARSSIVLLKNEGALLPFSAGLRSIAVIGPSAAVARQGETGSSRVRPFRRVSPLRGLRERAGTNTAVRYQRGSGLSERLSPRRLRAAVELARASDVAVVVGGLDETFERESLDRRGNDLVLPAAQVELIEAVLGANPRTVVVLVAGGAIAMSGWGEKAPAILHAWYPGEQGGRALAELLFGDVSPAGRLPISFPRSVEQLPAHPRFPEQPQAVYREGIFVGYRHFDRERLDPLFPFGHGLSYTEFRYEGLGVEVEGAGREFSLRVRFRVANIGAREAAEVAQLYVSDLEAGVERPPAELRRFARVTLRAGESRELAFELGYRDLAFWSEQRQDWVVEPGEFEVRVGGSSRDIRLRAAFRCP